MWWLELQKLLFGGHRIDYVLKVFMISLSFTRGCFNTWSFISIPSRQFLSSGSSCCLFITTGLSSSQAPNQSPHLSPQIVFLLLSLPPAGTLVCMSNQSPVLGIQNHHEVHTSHPLCPLPVSCWFVSLSFLLSLLQFRPSDSLVRVPHVSQPLFPGSTQQWVMRDDSQSSLFTTQGPSCLTALCFSNNYQHHHHYCMSLLKLP